MRSEVSVRFDERQEFRLDTEEVQPMPHDVARGWLDEQFTRLGCEPLRATGKVLTADKVLLVAQAAGVQGFADAKWAGDFARAVEAALAKPVVRIDVGAMTITY